MQELSFSAMNIDQIHGTQLKTLWSRPPLAQRMAESHVRFPFALKLPCFQVFNQQKLHLCIHIWHTYWKLKHKSSTLSRWFKSFNTPPHTTSQIHIYKKNYENISHNRRIDFKQRSKRSLLSLERYMHAVSQDTCPHFIMLRWPKLPKRSHRITFFITNLFHFMFS